MKKAIYRHIYDNPFEEDGTTKKPNEFLGIFEIPENSIDDYSFHLVGKKDGKRYKITGQEVSSMVNRYNAGTICYAELIEEVDYKDTNLTESEKEEGYFIERCTGNTHRRGCGKSFKALSWHTPSGCPHCPCSRVS